MPLNLLKKYPELLDIGGLGESQRQKSLHGVFARHIENNQSFAFRKKRIYPIKGEEPAMQLLLRHLTTVEVKEKVNGRIVGKRVFELQRSQRLHWILPHTEETTGANVEVFSCEERAGGKWLIRTYILNHDERYVVILEPHRKPGSYYLITAYYLDRKHSYRKIRQKASKRKLDEVH